MSPTTTFLFPMEILSSFISLDQPAAGGGDVSQGVEPNHPMEVETGNQPDIPIHVERAVDLYRPESQVSGTACDTLHHLQQPGTY
jgi:hypothetical protein